VSHSVDDIGDHWNTDNHPNLSLFTYQLDPYVFLTMEDLGPVTSLTPNARRKQGRYDEEAGLSPQRGR